jgi:transketolase
MLETAVDVCEILTKHGRQPELISMHTVKPIDKELIIKITAKCQMIITIEEHSIIGGLGSRVADVITEEGLKVRLKKFAIPDRYAEIAGSRDYLKKYFGLTAEQISENLLSEL